MINLLTLHIVGLVTYRETALLYHQNVSSSKTKARVAGVIAHELGKNFKIRYLFIYLFNILKCLQLINGSGIW